jgi:hypothetical protein
LVAALLATAGNAAGTEAPVPRAALIAQGEAALAHRDTAAAEQSFDQAGAISHSADAELGLVRTYMQAGAYRRALAFVAHTAGAHIDEPSGAALQSWLLFLGGQRVPAKRFLAEALERNPGNPVLLEVHRQLDSGSPLAHGILLEPPSRFAPYGATPASGIVSGTGWLFDAGRRALVPLASLKGSSFAWVRNGVGSVSRAVLVQRDSRSGVATLRLSTPMPSAPATMSVRRDPFAGAPAYSAGYVEKSGAPAWPILRAGFFASPVEGGRFGKLDFDDAAQYGGPVFDASGRFAGLALGRESVFVPVTRLDSLVGASTPTEASATAMPADEIYERALASTLQVITPAPR